MMDVEEVAGFPINTDHSARKVWLVKVPQFLYERWFEEDETDADTNLGSVTIDQQLDKSVVTLTLPSASFCNDLPSQYKFNSIKNPRVMYVFSETADNEPVAIEGKVEHEWSLNPVMDEKYQALMRSRNIELNKPKRTIKVVDSVQDGVRVGLIQHVSEAELLSKRRRKYSPDQKRERLPKPELMDLIFSAFEKYTNWTLKGLVEFTQQPTVYLKEVLSEICIFVNRGPQKNTYQLKSEYKRIKH